MIQVVEQDITAPKESTEVIIASIKAALDKKNYHIVVNLCSDQFMLEQNNKSLGHNYYTDIITYFYDRENPLKDAELLISIERVRDNAINQNESFNHELARVAIHGCLHLIGLNDSTDKEKQLMRKEENKILKKVFHVER